MTASPPTIASPRRILSGMPGFVVANLLIVGLFAPLLTLFLKGPGDGKAIMTSAILALAVQIGSFAGVRRLAARNFMAGWGAGSLIRFFALFVYALIAGPVLALPLPTALISLAVFYFPSMVVEPLFLRS